MDFKGKRILITGGTGFIGSNLAKKLTSLGGDITIYSNSEGNDIRDKNKLTEFVKKEFHLIFHLAGMSGAPADDSNKTAYFEVNTIPVIELCDLLVEYSPHTKLILSGTRLEYGIPQYLPVDEKHPTFPNSLYGLSKLAASQTAMGYFYQYGLDVTVFRTSNVYGPHPKIQSDKNYNIMNKFIDLALADQEITIFGDGEQERDYLFVDDLIEAFTLACFNPTAGQIYNIGYGKGVKFKTMIEEIIKVVGKGSVKYVEWPQSFKKVETGSYITDLTKIHRELGFSPKTDILDGITKTSRATS